MGGPIYIPKIYNGHNKTFWFFNYEEFLETNLYGFNDTVPTANYLNGNFSQISANGTCSACAQLGIQATALGTPTVQVDPNGNHVFANEIFDPATRAVATPDPSRPRLRYAVHEQLDSDDPLRSGLDQGPDALSLRRTTPISAGNYADHRAR